MFTEHGLADSEIGTLERHAFYERARAAFAVVRTGELRKYGNILLVKGVVNRYERSQALMVVVFGSINLDLVARVPRLPAAGETISGPPSSPSRRQGRQPGARCAAGRCRVAMFGAVGRDASRPRRSSICALRASTWRRRAVDAPTGIALINVDDHGENAITVVPGANAHARAAQVPDALLGAGNTLLLQLEVPVAEVASLAARAQPGGARVVLNAAPAMPLCARPAARRRRAGGQRARGVVLCGGVGHCARSACSSCAAVAEHFGLAVVVTVGRAWRDDGHRRRAASTFGRRR